MRQYAVVEPVPVRRGWPPWVRGLVMAAALGAAAPSVWAPVRPPMAPTTASGSAIPSLLTGWVGGNAASSAHPLCPSGGVPGQCLATPYGTVLTGMMQANRLSTTTASVWIRPLSMGEWRPSTAPVRLASVGSAGTAAPAVSLIGATGSWVVAKAYGPSSMVSVDAINLGGGHVTILTTLPSSSLASVQVGSHMALVDNGSYLEVYQLPATATGTPALTLLPESERTQAIQSLGQGFLAPDIVMPGLPPAPGNAGTGGLASYAVGTWDLPFRAPRGWVVVPPHDTASVTSVALVNPTHPGEWVAIRTDPGLTLTETLNGGGRAVAIGLPSARGSRIAWLSDRTIAFSTPSGREVVNGVIYPNALGGVVELEVSLPPSEKPLATAILDSAHLPY